MSNHNPIGELCSLALTFQVKWGDFIGKNPDKAGF